MAAPIRFGLVGAGWRAEFFTRIAAALPERFEIVGVHTRDAAKAVAFAAKWRLPVCDTLEALADKGPDFVVASISVGGHVEICRRLHALKQAVLLETPAAADVAGMIDIWRMVEQGLRIHVAEQYIYEPLHAARLALITEGWIGTPSFARVATAHGYHGVSLMRRFLKLGFEDASIRARIFTSPAIQGGSRAGPPIEEKLVTGTQTIGDFDFGDRLGLFDFTDIQYWSYVRSHRVVIRGERGEITDNEVRYLRAFNEPVVDTLRRRDRGHGQDLDGHYLDSVLLGGDTVFHNPFWRARLMDDEIAIAEAMVRMAAYVRGEGEGPYSFADAAQDQYLALMLAEAAKSGEVVRTSRQPWAQ